jgi:UDP-N-acetylglucosamine acyltransferase
MQRHGISDETIAIIRRVFRMLYRQHTSLDEVRAEFNGRLGGVFPFELSMLLNFVEQQRRGKMGRAREAVRDQPSHPENSGITERRAA